MFLSVHLSVSPSIQAHISVTASRNFFNLGMMMASGPGLMLVLMRSMFSDDHADPLPFYSTIYNLAVVNIVLFNYLFTVLIEMLPTLIQSGCTWCLHIMLHIRQLTYMYSPVSKVLLACENTQYWCQQNGHNEITRLWLQIYGIINKNYKYITMFKIVLYVAPVAGRSLLLDL